MRVIVRVCGIQTIEDSQTDKIESISEGTLESSAKGFSVFYDEPAEAAQIRAHLEILTDSVSLSRENGVLTNMLFKTDHRFSSLCRIDKSSFEVTIETKILKIDMSGKGGGVRAEYAVYIDGLFVSNNILVIYIEPV